MMDDQVCPRCKTTKYRNPSLKLMLNVCGHALCESCVELLFVKGSGSCPECGVPLKRVNFRYQYFEDSAIDREVEIRKRVIRDFNKREEDFDNLKDYNDYLEQIESIIFNLTHNIDVFETNKMIEQYKKENKELIVRNRSRPSQALMEIEDILESEKKTVEMRKKVIQSEEKAEKEAKVKDKEALIEELMFSEADAAEIVAQAKIKKLKSEENKKSLFSSGVGTQVAADAAPHGRPEEVLYVYVEPKLDLDGPGAPTESQLVQHNYISHIKKAGPVERAGGYTETVACLRVLQDAMSGLYFSKA